MLTANALSDCPAGKASQMYTLSEEQQVSVISALLKGNSIRGIERTTGIHRDTICRLLVQTGQNCAALMDTMMRGFTREGIDSMNSKALSLIGDYLWLIAGCFLIWMGLIGMYVIYVTGMPSTPSMEFSLGLSAFTSSSSFGATLGIEIRTLPLTF
jgi:hypothetical protein